MLGQNFKVTTTAASAKGQEEVKHVNLEASAAAGEAVAAAATRKAAAAEKNPYLDSIFNAYEYEG